MRITCPICGARDRREFTVKGAALALERPARDAGDVAWDDYLHNRDNPAGRSAELWYHETGCAAWIVVVRDTVTHEVFETRLAAGDTEAGS
jgi:sarcosine oxidase subunit delta